MGGEAGHSLYYPSSPWMPTPILVLRSASIQPLVYMLYFQKDIFSMNSNLERYPDPLPLYLMV